MKLLHVVGARPNFMKASPVFAAIENLGFAKQSLIHTGQHYDRSMSQVFFSDLNLRAPDLNLAVGSGTHSYQTARIMMSFEDAVEDYLPDMVLVYGDVNSSLAASLVCAKKQIPTCHVEAGLRSRDRTMPEEINRILTDQISDLLFTPSLDANDNLLSEGVPSEKIYFVGNVMIDTLIRLLPLTAGSRIHEQLHIESNSPYVLVTLHRPSNVDALDQLEALINGLEQIGKRVPVVFPVHPRTLQRIEDLNYIEQGENLKLVKPLGYLDFLALQRQATAVITDSGGIQEETTYLDVPCLTMRTTTERPITVTMGSNMLLGEDVAQMIGEIEKILNGQVKESRVPPRWDGKASERIAKEIWQWQMNR